MKIEEVKPSIRQFMFRQERGDPDFGSCMWASFILDTKNYTLHIASDCGEYAYGWTPTPKSESFVHLMARIGEDYLLYKIANRDQFDYETSKAKTIENLKIYFEDEPEKVDNLVGEIEYHECVGDIQDSYDCFFKEMDGILADANVLDSYELINGVLDYSAGAKKIAQIFCEVLQPLLKAEQEVE